MGKHYVPQKYLRGFSDPSSPSKIWMYDKKTAQFAYASIEKVAQEADFYSDDTEKQLSQRIESPAHKVLNRLRRGERMTSTERATLGLYLGTMMMRVPRRRRKGLDLLPEVLDETIRETHEQVRRWAELPTTDPVLAARRFAELEAARAKLANTVPDGVLEQIRSPWPSADVLSLIHAMTWRIVSTESDTRFLTSDNPAYFFSCYGLGNEESELVLPLDSNLALIANWQGSISETRYLSVTRAVSREINRRVASGAERFVFYHQRRSWVAKVAVSYKSKPFLNRIRWNDRESDGTRQVDVPAAG